MTECSSFFSSQPENILKQVILRIYSNIYFQRGVHCIDFVSGNIKDLNHSIKEIPELNVNNRLPTKINL